jgi:DNA polymerase III delta subunit
VTIYLFHGENQPALRDALLELRKSYGETIFWEKDYEELPVYLASPTFSFAGPASQELIIIEDPELSRLPELVGLAAKGSKDVVFAFSDKIAVKKLPAEAAIRYFREEIPKNVFPFLDALVAKDKKKAFTEAHRLLSGGKDVHSLLLMIVWQLRTLVRVKDGAAAGLHPYALKKLSRVSGNFDGKELSQAFSLLLKEDLALKKGKANAVTFDFLIEKLISG